MICYCRRDYTGHEHMPGPILIQTKSGFKQINQCPATKDSPKKRTDKAMRMLPRPVIYPVPRYAAGLTQPRKAK